ncbi:MAG: DUF2279 domain-containing protein [Bacteroidota bacterium]
MMRRTIANIFFGAIFIPYALSCKTEGNDSSGATISGSRLAVVIGVSGGIIAGAHLVQYNHWWKGPRSEFRFVDDSKYALNADKLGHAYFARVVTDLMAHSLMWAGVDHLSALWYGAGVSMLFQTYVEVEDGFAKNIGFSPGDFGANIAGALYPVAQHYLPFLRNALFKWSLYPSEKYMHHAYAFIIDDYESQYFWLSISVHNLLPRQWRRWYPSFLNVAVGYSVRDLDLRGGGERQWFIALDYDFEKLPGDGWFLRALKHVLNVYHFPAPTIQLRPHVVAYGFHF